MTRRTGTAPRPSRLRRLARAATGLGLALALLAAAPAWPQAPVDGGELAVGTIGDATTMIPMLSSDTPATR